MVPAVLSSDRSASLNHGWHLFSISVQRQHHHQHNQLCNQRVCRLCHFLHPGLHGTQPERPSVRGGRPRPGPGLCGLPRSPHSAPHLTPLVAAFLLHAHPPGTRNSGEVGRGYSSWSYVTTVQHEHLTISVWLTSHVAPSTGQYEADKMIQAGGLPRILTKLCFLLWFYVKSLNNWINASKCSVVFPSGGSLAFSTSSLVHWFITFHSKSVRNETRDVVDKNEAFNWSVVPRLVVLSAGDPGDSHRGWDWYRMDHQTQNHSHAVSGHRWILTGRATNHAGKPQFIGITSLKATLS